MGYGHRYRKVNTNFWYVALIYKVVSNQPFSHWRLPSLSHLHPESSGEKQMSRIPFTKLFTSMELNPTDEEIFTSLQRYSGDNTITLVVYSPSHTHIQCFKLTKPSFNTSSHQQKKTKTPKMKTQTNKTQLLKINQTLK